MQQLSGMDSIFLATERLGAPQHIGGVSIYDPSTAPGGKVRFKDVLQLFQDRAHLSPIFRRRLVDVPLGLDQPYWIEDRQFDPEFHVRHIALPKPGDWRQLCILSARIHSRPLDLARPMWEVYVIEGLDGVEGVPKGSFALLTKVHHCAMDGVTGMQFFGALHDLSPEPREVRRVPPMALESTPSARRLLTRAWLNTLRRPMKVVDLVREGVGSYTRLAAGRREHAFHELDGIPRTRFQEPLTPSRVVGAVKFDFADMRRIKQAIEGATINDAAVTIVAGALRKYLIDKEELPGESLVTGCPVDVRHDGERDADGNMVGLMNLALRTDIEDPLERLNAVREESRAAKARFLAAGPRVGMQFLDTVPSGIMSLVVRAVSAAGLGESAVPNNTIVTNVPGAREQLYFAGAVLVDQISLGVLAPGVGLFHSVNSQVHDNRGVLSLSFLSCREMLPDPAFYAQCLRESFEELSAACGQAACVEST
jgi:WS/DGAT/MGAT family acyltransferase